MLSVMRKRPHDTENERKKERSLAMAAFTAAANLGDLKTMKELMDIGVAKMFMVDLQYREKNRLLDMILTKIENVDQLISSEIVFIPTAEFVENNPSSKGLFTVIFIPETDVKMHLMIYPPGVCNSDPSSNPDGCYPLHLLCLLPDIPTKAVSYLLECNPCDINQGTYTGYTALIIAIIRGNLPLVKFLVKRGASLNNAPIIYVKLKELGSYYIYLKVFSPIKETFPKLYYYFTPLEAAVLSNQEDILCYLIKKGANVHSNQGRWCSLFHPIVMKHRGIFDRLLESGVDVNGSDFLGSSPLHKTVEEGHMDLTCALMKKGANVNAKDHYGWTPLHIASLFSRDVSLEIIQLLLDGGTDIEATTKIGFTPLNLAVAGNDLSFLEYLADNIENLDDNSGNACTNGGASTKGHEDLITLLLDRGASCNHQDDFLGWTALHWAAAAGNLKTVQLLVSRGATISIESKFMLDAYQTALYFKRADICSFLLSVTGEVPPI